MIIIVSFNYENHYKHNFIMINWDILGLVLSDPGHRCNRSGTFWMLRGCGL